MQVKTTEFIKSAAKPQHYPPESLPEIAFAGRSNVGKSSMINTLLNRRGLVRTSSTPGRTQLLNFFNVNDTFHLVDLPGYGFARVPMAVKRSWGPMIRAYLEKRRTLKGVVLILDIRRTPSTEDLQFLDWLEEYEIPTIPVITKVDKVPRSKLDRYAQAVASTCGLTIDAFTLFSATSRMGRNDVWDRIGEALDLESENGKQLTE